MSYFRRNGNIIGDPKTISSSSTSGIWDLDTSNKLIQDSKWPGTSTFPVDNAELQWVMSAQGGPSTFTSGTNHDLSDGNTQVYSGNWTSSLTLTKTSYTNSSGTTRYYYPLNFGANLRTSSNTSSNSSMSSNGYTFYICMIPSTSASNWGRPFNYYGVANGSTTTSIGDTDEFDGPLIFTNPSRSDVQYRRPSNNTSNGDYAYTASGSISYGTSRTLSIVVAQYTNGSAKYWIRNSGWNGSTYSTYNASTFSFAGSAGYGIRSGTNTGIPVFADQYYHVTQNYAGFMEAGWANKTYTDTECYDLIQHLDTKYG